MEEYKYYIAGEFFSSPNKIKVANPATEEVFAAIFEATEQDLGLALQTARTAQRQWRAVPFKERANILREIARTIVDNLQVLAELESREIGKPLKESLFVDIPLAADCFNYYASFLDNLEEEMFESDFGIDLVKYEPFGICAAFLPYNVPLMIFGFSCAGALAAGNALIIKPSEYGCLSVLKLAQFLSKLDIPKGLINIVTGRGEVIGKALARSNVDIISFTGSRDVLKDVIKQTADSPKKVVCELGGCNLAAVFSDADKQEAVKNVLAASFIKQGQACIGTSLVLVQEGIYNDFVQELIKDVSGIKLADPFQPDTGMGPLPTKEHLNQVHRRVKDLEAKGAKVLCGGSPLNQKGFFYPPTIIEVNEIIYEEFFAPVVLIKSFADEQQLLNVLENSPTGLVLQIWTKDSYRATELAKKAEYGTVWINTFAQMTSKTPFGGFKHSGWGRNLGRFGFFEYIQPKHIGIGTKASPVSGWYGI